MNTFAPAPPRPSWGAAVSAHRGGGRVGPKAQGAVLTLVLWLGLAGPVAAQAAPAAAGDGGALVELVVRRQDTLIGLGRRLFTSPTAWRDVARLNRLVDPNRLAPGQTLRVPEALLRWEALDARVATVAGSVRAEPPGGAAARELAAGDRLPEGSAVSATTSGSAVLELADGSRVKLQPDSAVQITRSRRYGASPALPAASAAAAPGDAGDGWFTGAMRLISGSVEIVASKLRRAKPLETQTPTAVIGVRGTAFRVGLGGEGSAQFTRTEVLEGTVQADSTVAKAGTPVQAGFGAALDARGSPPVLRSLPPAPDLSAVPALFERPVLRFASPATEVPVRVQVAADEGFERVVFDQAMPAGSEIRIGGLDDGTWQMRARRIDASGIEGQDAQRALVLKARPEPPASIAPRPAAKANLGPVDLEWTANTQAQRYRVQVAASADFAQPLVQQNDLAATRTRVELPAAGVYHWRLASVRTGPGGQPDNGPWGDAQTFELKALPEPPKGGAAQDGSIQLAWSGRPQDKFQVELARDEAFTQVVAQAEVATAQWEPPKQKDGGAYYFRYRSVEPDGWVSPPSSTLRIDVPQPERGYLWLLAPLLLLL